MTVTFEQDNGLQEAVKSNAQLKTENERNLKSFNYSGINNKSLQTKLVILGQDLGNFGPNGDGVDGDLGNKTFLAIKNVQEKLELPITGVADFALITLLYYDRYRGYNKTKRGFEKGEDTLLYIQEKLGIKKESIKVVKNNSKNDRLVLNTSISKNNKKVISHLSQKYKKTQRVEQEKEQVNEEKITTPIIDNYPDISNNYRAQGKLYTPDGTTRCAGIARDTIEENGIKPFHYTAKGGKYNYTNIILNPRKKDANIFVRSGVTVPKSIIKVSSFDRNSEIGYKGKNGEKISEIYHDNFKDLNTLLKNGEQVTIVMSSNTSAGKKWGHLVTGMKLNGELLIIDPHFNKSNRDRTKPINFNNYSLKRNITGVIVYKAEDNLPLMTAMKKTDTVNV